MFKTKVVTGLVLGAALVGVGHAGAVDGHAAPAADRFVNPPQAANGLTVSTAQAPGDTDWFDVPLRLEDGRLLVPVGIGHGVEVDFIVSTANTVTVLNQAFIDNHGVDGEFFLGGVEVNLDNYATVSNEQLNPGGTTIVGIIGANTLNEFDVLFDVPGGRLVLSEVGRSMDFEGVTLGDALRLRVFHGLLLGADFELGGTTLPALIDTGSDEVLVNAAGAAAAGAADGESTTLRAGPLDFGSVPLTVQDLPMMERWDPNGEGFVVLGSPIAGDCAFAVSWVHREMRRCVR